MNIGIHYSNKQWEAPSPQDFQRLKLSKPECIKTCLFTQVGYDQIEVHKQLQRDFPDALIVARLFAGMGGGPWPAADFAKNFRNQIAALEGVVTWFEVHNEPNHERNVEGFGNTQAEYEEFAHWAERVLQLLKQNHPWAKWVFPGQLVDGGNHVNFWKANLDVIRQFDAWGVHCYWQFDNHTSREWGRCYEVAHELVPDKPIIITEFGDSHIFEGRKRTPAEKIPYYREWYQEADRQPYILGTALYILGPTPDWITAPGVPNFDVTEEMARAIGDIPRQDRQTVTQRDSKPVTVPEKPAPPPPQPAKELKPGMVSNQDIITTFANISRQLGLGQWDLLGRAGLNLTKLAAQRQAPFGKRKIDELPGLTIEQRTLIKAELVRRVSLRSGDEAVNVDLGIQPGASTGLLLKRPELVGTPLNPTRDMRINLAQAKSALEKRVAKVWNWYSLSLLAIADALELDPAVVVAVAAYQSDQRGKSPDGRLFIRFEPQVFYEKWGRNNADTFNAHFKFDHNQPQQGHGWRASATENWHTCHDSQQSEWNVFVLARTLDETAAKLSVRMGLTRMMGFNYAILGYQNVNEMFEAFGTSERYQLFALFDFIAGESGDNRRLLALRKHDFDTFAALHYGFGQAARFSVALHEAEATFERLNPVQNA
jgi:hypothetical protein